MHRILTSAVVGLLVLAVAACDAAGSPSPSGSPAPSTGAAPSPSTGAAASPSPTPSPSPSPDLHGAPELEARLPATIGGVDLTTVSLTGPAFLAGGGEVAQGQLNGMLDDLGKTAEDLTVAEASDPTGMLVFQEGLFRVQGSDAMQLLAAWVAAQQAAMQQRLEVTTTTIAGHAVTVLTNPNDPVGGTTYALAVDDTIVLVLADDRALVEEAFGLI
jgi:hypothetical protein